MSRGSSPTRMYVAICEKEDGCGYDPISFYLPEEPMFVQNTTEEAGWYFSNRLDTRSVIALYLTLEDWNSKHAWAVKSPPAKPVEEKDDAEYEYIFRASYDNEMEPRVDGLHVGLDEIQEGNRKAESHGKEIGKVVDYYKIVQDDDEEMITILYHYKDVPKTELLGDLKYTNNLHEIHFGSRKDACGVISNLLEEIRKYGYATVAEFKEQCGIETDYSDQFYGWYSLNAATVRWTESMTSPQYCWIDFPLPCLVRETKPKKKQEFNGRGRFA